VHATLYRSPSLRRGRTQSKHDVAAAPYSVRRQTALLDEAAIGAVRALEDLVRPGNILAHPAV
jgi:hypothetical protein